MHPLAIRFLIAALALLHGGVCGVEAFLEEREDGDQRRDPIEVNGGARGLRPL